MHRPQTHLDPVRRRIAFAEFVQGEVHLLKEEYLQEQFAFLGHHARTPDGAGLGCQLPGFDKQFLETLNRRRAHVKHGGGFSNRVGQGMVKQPASEIQ